MDEIQRMMTALGDITAKLLGKEPPGHQIFIFDQTYLSGDLFDKIFDMLANGDICGAEDLLFRVLEEDYTETKYLVGVEFYNELTSLGESYLMAHEFSLAEVVQGIKDLERINHTKGLGELISKTDRRPTSSDIM